MDFQALSSRENIWLLVIISIAVVALIAVIAAVSSQRKRQTTRLRSQFGAAEYDRAVKSGESRRAAEAGLDGRIHRVEELRLRPLGEGDRARFLENWRGVQSRFVDGPAGAVMEADQLLGDVMSTRGYPVGEFEQRAADVSVDHPLVLERYRAAHEICLRQARAQASTEDLRQAMVHYRTLFEELLSDASPSTARTAL